MPVELTHERLDLYRVYLQVAALCNDIVAKPDHQIAALDHLDRAVESIGVNFMRANVLAPGSRQHASCLDVAIASVNESAAALDVCNAKRAVDGEACKVGIQKLWRVRGMLLGLKQTSVGRVKEESGSYKAEMFPFMGLTMYMASLESVRWTDELLLERIPRGRAVRKLDQNSTGTVLNIAEGHGRTSVPDQNRFMRIAEMHAFQTILLLDLMVARGETTATRVDAGKAIQARIISMLHVWCDKNEQRDNAQK
jgi:hypothetical protein